MTIDLRYLLPLAAPFGMYLFIRFFCFFTGVEVTEEDNTFIAMGSFIFGVAIGGGVMMACLEEGVEIGRVKLWERKP